MPEIKIDVMTFGPDAIGRVDGEAVMVANAAPGDVLEVALTGRRRGRAIGKIVSVVTPSNLRREAPCRYFGACGGCDWMHLRYDAQAKIKAALASSILSHALDAQIDVEIEPARDEFAYRSRIRLGVDRRGAIGFRAAASDELIAIDECLVSRAPVSAAIELATQLAGAVAEIEIAEVGEKVVLVAHLARTIERGHVARASKVLESSAGRIAGIVIRAKEHREVLGDAKISIDLEDGLSICADADVFSQVNREQNIKLIVEVMTAAAMKRGQTMLDLYCGAGNFSLPAARRDARVTGVDASPDAVEAARANAARLGLASAEFIAMKASATAEFLRRARFRPDVVVLDPPRAGALDLMAPIAAMKPRAVVYVSCDVTTLGRDLRELSARGYKISRARAFDFFPNTHHIEVAATALLT